MEEIKDELKSAVIKTADFFTVEKNMMKVLEECAELSEVLLKRINKPAESKPSINKVIEEIGDVMFRLSVLTTQLKIEEEVMDRLIQKGEQVDECIERLKSNN